MMEFLQLEQHPDKRNKIVLYYLRISSSICGKLLRNED